MEGLFGRNYESVGKSSADFLIKTKGKVKIKWGNKYIDLVKDGKINADVKLFKKVASEDDIASAPGSGIFITEDGQVFIKDGDTIIPIVQDASSSNFVAFELQEGKTGEEKMFAQKNIGILAETVDELNSYGIQSGIAFISSESAIYTISGGVATKLEFKIPNPITDPLHVLVDQANYSLLLEGYFSENGNKLIIGNETDGIEIYAERDGKHIDSSTDIIISINGKSALTVSNDETKLDSNLIIGSDKEIVTDTIRNDGGSRDNGFLMEMDGDESWLYIDNIVVRNDPDSFVDTEYSEILTKIEEGSLEPGVKYRFDFMNEWDMLEEREEDSFEGDLFLNKNVYKLVVTATSHTTLSKYAYFYEYPQWQLEYDPTPDNVTDAEGEVLQTFGRITRLIDEYGNSANFDFKHLRFYIDGKWKYLFQFFNERNQMDVSEEEGVEELVVAGDGSCTGEIRNTVVEVNPDNLQRMAFPNREYTLGGNVTMQMKGTFSDCTFKTFTESAIIGADDGASNDSKIVAGEINGCEVNCSVVGCDVVYDVINSLKVKGEFSYNKLQGFLLAQEINGMTYCYASGRLEGNTLPENIIRCYFRGDVQNQDLTGEGSGIFTDGQPTDVYVWKGELRTIRMPDTVFPGMIVMYDGRKPVPTGWAICDGGNGTPNLIDKYIKASTEAGLEGGNENNEITLTIDQMPAHSHTVDIPESGTGSGGGEGTQAVTQSVARASVTTGETGGGQPVNIEPQYYTLIFIMYIGYSENYY